MNRQASDVDSFIAHIGSAVPVRAPDPASRATSQRWTITRYLPDCGQLKRKASVYAGCRALAVSILERGTVMLVGAYAAAQAQRGLGRFNIKTVSRRGSVIGLGSRPPPVTPKTRSEKVPKINTRPLTTSLGAIHG